MDRFPLRISPRGGGFDLSALWRYRDLIALLTRRSILIQYKQTVLGPAWILLSPVISALAYAFVFGGIGGISTDGVPKLLFYLCSTNLWGFFAGLVTKNAAVFSDNVALFGKVYFPRLAVPVSHFLSALVQLTVQLLLVLGLLMVYVAQGQVRPDWAAWWVIPVAVAQLGILGMGVGLLLSALTAKYRDLKVLVQFGMQLWMYATPVVYPLSAAGDWGWLLGLNPVTAPMELIRTALLGQGTVTGYGLSLLVTAAVAAVGIGAFSRTERTFVDTI